MCHHYSIKTGVSGQSGDEAGREAEAVGGDAQRAQAMPAFGDGVILAVQVQVPVQHGLDAVRFEERREDVQGRVVDQGDLHGAALDRVQTLGQPGHLAGDDLLRLRLLGFRARRRGTSRAFPATPTRPSSETNGVSCRPGKSSGLSESHQ